MPLGALHFLKGSNYYGTKKKNVFPNTPWYFVQMILNNLQKQTKSKQTKSKDKEKVFRKILLHVPIMAKHNGTHKSNYGNLSNIAGFLRQ